MSDRKGFLPIEEQQAALKLVRDAAKLHSPATSWARDQRYLDKSHITGFDFNRGCLMLEINELTDLALLREEMQLDPHLMIKTEAHHQEIFFKSAFRSVDLDAGKIEMALPQEVFRMQMRKHPRARMDHLAVVSITHPDPQDPNRILDRRLYDLSLGGASLILHYGEERHYHVRQRLESLELNIPGGTVKTWGIVRHLKVFPQDTSLQGVQLGIEFFNLGPIDLKRIDALVQSELRKQFAELDGAKD